MANNKDFNYRLQFAGVDKLSSTLGKIRQAIGKSSQELTKFRTLEKQFGKFSTLRKNAPKLQNELRDASKETARLGQALSKAENPTRAMTAEFKRAQKAVQSLKSQQAKEISELGKLGKKLRRAGYETDDYAKGQRRLKSDLSRSTKELEDHRRELKRVGNQYRKGKSARDKYQKSLQNAANLGVVGASGVAVGTRTLRGTFGLVDSIRPQEANIGKLKTLGKTDEDIATKLKIFEKVADKFAYIETSDLFGADYDVVSALSGLDSESQAYITGYSAVLARATDANAAEITGLATTAHGLFKEQSKQLSDMEWFDEFSATIGASVKAFKTTGPKMEQAFKSAGPIAAGVGFTMEEYASILGAGQKTMEAGDIGTAFAAYSAGLAKAQKAFDTDGIDIQLLNKKGKRREIGAVLADFQKTFGADWDATELETIKQAFGRKEAQKFILAMKDAQADMIAGREAIDANKLQGMASVENMAMAGETNGDAQIQKAIEDLRTMKQDLGYALLPVFTALIGPLKKVTGWISRFAKEHKTLVGIIGAGVVIFGALAAVMGGITIAIASMLGPFAVLRFATSTLGLKSLGLTRILGGLGKALLWVGRAALPALIGGVRAFGIALMTTPLGWIIAGIAALAAGAYLIIKYWKPIKAFFGRIWRAIGSPLDGLGAKLKAFGKLALTVFKWSPLGLLMRGFGVAFKWLKQIFDSPKTALNSTWDYFKLVFSWSPLGLLMRGFGVAFNWLKNIFSSPQQALDITWDHFKFVFAWSPLGLLMRGFGAAFNWLSRIFGGPEIDAKQAWTSLKSILSWSPKEQLKKIWNGLPGLFTAPFDKSVAVVKNAMEKVKGLMAGPLGLLKKIKKGAGELVEKGAGKLKEIKSNVSLPKALPVLKATLAAGAVAAAPTAAFARYNPTPHLSPGPSVVTPAKEKAGKTETGPGKIEMNIHAAPGMDEKALAKYVADEFSKRERETRRKSQNSLSDLEDE